MNTPISPDFAPEIQIINDRITTTSLAVSKTFGKDHKNVLRDIQNLECPKDFHALNFEPMFIEVKVGNGAVRKDPAFFITRDGFTLLAMGFTGKRAMEFKIRYIEAFNRMEEEFRRQHEESRRRSRIGREETVPPPPTVEWQLERDRLRLETMRLRTDRAMKLKKITLAFRDREIFGLAEARKAALDAVSLLTGEDPSGPTPGSEEPIPAEEDSTLVADVCRALSLTKEPTALLLLMASGDPQLESWLLDRGILPTSRTMRVCIRISRKIFNISHEIHDRVLEEEKRIPSFQETLEEAIKQFLNGMEG